MQTVVISNDQTARVVQAGAQEAAQALSRLLRRPVDVAGYATADARQLENSHDKFVVVLAFEASGGAPGQLVFVLDEAVAAAVVASLTGASSTELSKAALSALAEVGNIAASAFLNGAARVVGATCLPSVPRVSHAPVEQIVVAVLPARPFHLARLTIDDVGAISLAFSATG